MGKYAIAIIAIIVVLVGLMAFLQKPEAPVEPQNTAGQPTSQIEGPTPTGNVDDVVAAIMKDTENDAVPAAETDASLVAENEQAVGDFGKAFDASVF